MDRIQFLKSDVAALKDLLAEVDDDPLLGPQFRERLAEVESKLHVAEAADKGRSFPTEAQRTDHLFSKWDGALKLLAEND